MATFKVRCVDRATAKPYDAFITADTPVEASRVASSKHVLAANQEPVLVPDAGAPSPAPPSKSAVDSSAPSHLAAIERILTGQPERRFRTGYPKLARTIRHSVFWGIFVAQFAWLLVFLVIWLFIAIPQYGREQEEWSKETEAKIRELETSANRRQLEDQQRANRPPN